MAKITIIVPPLTGHINPTVALGQCLLERGHEVSWIGYSDVLQRSLPSNRKILALEYPTSNPTKPENVQANHQEARRGFAGLHFLWEDVLIPLARQSYPQVLKILKQETPDLCIVDQQMFSGALACQKLDLPYLTSSTTSAALIDALEALPQVAKWSNGLLEQLWEAHHLTTQAVKLKTVLNVDLQRNLDLSPYGVISFSSRKLALSALPDAQLPKRLHFVGPALEGNRAEIAFPWERLDPNRPRLFLSMGTINATRAHSLYARLIEALRETSIQVIAAAPVEAFEHAPKHWIIQSRVPQLQLLAHVDAVFCHGGHNTTVEALAFGLPLIITPIRDDQPVIAEQVKAVGAGIRLHFTRVKPETLRNKILQVLHDPQLKQNALEVRREFMGAEFMENNQSSQQRPILLAPKLGATRANDIIEQLLQEIVTPSL